MSSVHVEPGRQRDALPRCPYCHGEFAAGVAKWTCPKCGTLHHRECALENQCCTVLGCRHAVKGDGVVAPRVRPMRMPTSPRRQAAIGAALGGVAGVFGVIAFVLGVEGGGGVPGLYSFGLGGVAMLAVGDALLRAWREQRWRT